MAPEPDEVIGVLVVDDEALLRSGIAALVAAAPDLRVVGEAGDGLEAVERATALRPDVVLLDMQMPVMDGLDALDGIRRASPDTTLVVLTSYLTDDYILPALRAGASGYLLKDCTPQELHDGIRAAAAGTVTLSPAVSRLLLAAAGGDARGHRAAAVRRLAVLTPQERAVAAGLAGGRSNAQIATALFLAPATVKSYVASAMAKLGVKNRTQVAILAHEAGLRAG